MKQLLIHFLFISLMIGCGADSNINKTLFSIDGSNDGLTNQFVNARALYNTGDYDGAEKLARQVVKADSNNSDAALLLANILLAKAGLDPFEVTIKLISLQTDSTGATATNLQSSDSGVSSLFTSLASVLNISNEDLGNMGTVNTEDFADLPVIVPAKIDGSETDPRIVVPSLRYANEAISFLCPFVSDALRADGATDARHSCTKNENVSTVIAKHDLAWAMAHLVEAVAFNAVLTYSPTAEEANAQVQLQDAATGSNLLQRVTRMQTATPTTLSELSTFSGQMARVNTLVSAVFDTSETGMLNNTMDDIKAISGAFSGIAGMPESVTKQITASFDQLTQAAKTAQGTAQDGEVSATAEVEALREQMQEEIATGLSTSVDEALTDISADLSASELTEFNENKTEVCNNLNAILNYEEDSSDTTALPDSCT